MYNGVPSLVALVLNGALAATPSESERIRLTKNRALHGRAQHSRLDEEALVVAHVLDTIEVDGWTRAVEESRAPTLHCRAPSSWRLSIANLTRER